MLHGGSLLVHLVRKSPRVKKAGNVILEAVSVQDPCPQSESSKRGSGTLVSVRDPCPVAQEQQT